MFHTDYTGTKFPYSLLRTSKLRGSWGYKRFRDQGWNSPGLLGRLSPAILEMVEPSTTSYVLLQPQGGCNTAILLKLGVWCYYCYCSCCRHHPELEASEAVQKETAQNLPSILKDGPQPSTLNPKLRA